MGNEVTAQETAIKLKIQELLGKEVVQFELKGRGLVNNAYLVQALDGDKYIVKQERSDKEFQPQNDLLIEAKVMKCLSELGLSVVVPRVVFVSEDPKMYGYEYVEGEMLKEAWGSLSEDERTSIFRALGNFHAEIGKRLTREMAEKIGIQINPSVDIHPESAQECEEALASADVPEEFKALATKARTMLDTTSDAAVFQFLHNDSHHENIIIKDKKISGIIDFGNAEYGEIAKEFSRYIRDFPDHFHYIVEEYEKESGNRLSYQRLVSNAFLSGFGEIVESYRKGGEDRASAFRSRETYQRLLDGEG